MTFLLRLILVEAHTPKELFFSENISLQFFQQLSKLSQIHSGAQVNFQYLQPLFTDDSYIYISLGPSNLSIPLKMPNQIILIYKTYLYMNIQWSQQIIYNQCPLRLFIHLITNIVVRQPNLLVFFSPWKSSVNRLRSIYALNRTTMHDMSSLLSLFNASAVNCLAAAYGSLYLLAKSTTS